MQATLMTHPHQRHHPDAVVIGLGVTGLSVVRHLVRLGERVLVMDSRERPPGLDALRAGFPDVPVRLGPFDPDLLTSAPRLVVSPGVAVSEPAICAAQADGVEVMGDVELFAREAPAPVAAVTGSNGKSSVTALLGDMARAAGLRARTGGNLMPPALDLLDGDEADLYVLELSSFQLETTWSLAPQAAALLNISADHLDRYPDFAAYLSAKARIFNGAATAVVNLDDPQVACLGRDADRIVGFSLSDPRARARLIRRCGVEWLALDGEPVVQASQVALPGRHNLANALAAMAMAEALDISREAMSQAISAFRGLSHRCTLVAERGGVRWIDDSKGTNVGATSAAIDGLGSGRNLVLIAGGLAKGQDFSPLSASMARHVHTLVVLGRDAEVIAAVAPHGVACLEARDMGDAVTLAARAARPGDTVLLSPACASFDMFDGYAARGDAFAACLLNEGAS